MISVQDALDQILSNVSETCAEQVALPNALGRVLAEDILARLTQPRTDVSSMDGYAVKAGDTPDLNVIGESPAGGCYDGEVLAGQAVRIFTGAPVPSGANAVVMQENTTRDGDQVTINEPVSSGNFVRPAGLDFKTDEVLIKAGRTLTARDLGLAAAANVPWVLVRRKPRIAIIATGDEVVMPGDPLGPNQIVSSNSVMLSAYVKSLGAEVLDLGIARDDEASLTRLMKSASQADMLVTIGGASVGDYDLVNQVLGNEGVDLGFYKVAMRPGKPLIFGKLHGTPVLGLPGNPVSVGVTGAVFLQPVLKAMLGQDTAAHIQDAVLGTDIKVNDVRQDYLRAVLKGNVASPFSKQDSSMLARFADANCLIIRAPFADAAKAGDAIKVLML
ncbi:MAG: molybdopterin molybdenumtransferase MoeA [Rhodospirillaceae bacterium]|nr:MAG: molybdopterin molybdenumtransferase MoeA [Rhodospirillaceae bacterium]